jgi:putative endonuclease
MRYFVYMLTTRKNTVLYTGFTDDLGRRMQEHKEKNFGGFTARYSVDKLVYYVEFEDMQEATAREKQLKRYRRVWKIDLINRFNAAWKDLSSEFSS